MSATDAAAFPYAVHLDIKFNQTLCKVNDSVVRLGVMQASPLVTVSLHLHPE